MGFQMDCCRSGIEVYVVFGSVATVNDGSTHFPSSLQQSLGFQTLVLVSAYFIT